MSLFVYKSSAGSGKTSTLVTEFLKIALERKSDAGYQHILAITFTNKAAYEMKERILDALVNFANDTGKDTHIADALQKEHNWSKEELRKRSNFLLKDLLHHYSNLSISTIDSFVSRLVRSFSYDLHLPFRFKLEIGAQDLIQEAVDALIESVGKANPTLTNILTQYILSQTEKEASRKLEVLLGENAHFILDDALKPVFSELEHVEENQYTALETSLRKEQKAYLNKLGVIGEDVQNFLAQRSLNASDFPGKSGSVPALLIKLSKHKKLGSKSPFGKKLMSFGADGIKRPAKISAELLDAIDEFDSQFQSILQDLITQYEHVLVKSLIHDSLYNQATLNLIRNAFEDLKSDKNIIPLANFNELVNSLVLNEPIPFIYERIGEKYKHYMVDEFQDTSTIQWQNLMPLYANSLASSNFNMVVGDAKQSIYRFRGGDVEQFINLGNKDVKENLKSKYLLEHATTIHANTVLKELDTNYRSLAEVVAFNNWFFKEASSILPDKWRSVYYNLEQRYNKEESGGLVNIRFVQKQQEGIDAIKASVLERVALINSDASFKLSDICVLTKTKKEGKLVSEWLDEAGYKLFTQESLTLEKSMEVRLVIKYLAYLSKPSDSIAAVSVIAGLVEAGLLDDSIDLHSFFESTAKKPLELDELLKLRGFDISNNKQISLSLFTTVQSIISGFKLKYNAYLSKLSNEVLQFEQRNGNNLNSLIQHLENKLESISIQGGQAADAIQIMTMHKSKGLQFPIVIVPFANWRNANSASISWVPESDTGVALPFAMVKNVKRLEETSLVTYYNEEKGKESLDALNTLYVAFTRAKLQLHAYVKEDTGETNSFLQIIKNNQAYNAIDGSLTLGSGEARPSKTKEDSGKSKVRIHQRGVKAESIQLSTARLKALENAGKDEQLTGKAFHVFMEKTININSIERANAWLAKQPISENEKQKIHAWRNELFQNTKTKEFFKPEVNTWRETSLLSQGKKLRADLIVENDETLCVIDYKTGGVKPEHENQIREYGYVINQTVNKPIKLNLIYLSPFKVRDVRFEPDLFSSI